jgi:hypothetical protein
MRTSKILLALILIVITTSPAAGEAIPYEHTWPAFTCDCGPGTEITYVVSYREIGAADSIEVATIPEDGSADYTSPAFGLEPGCDYEITVWGTAVTSDGDTLRDHCTDAVTVPDFHHNGCQCRRITTAIN